MGLVEETALENGDPVFSKDQLENFSYQMLRNLGAYADTDQINGKSPMMLVKSYYGCQHSLSEWE